eukprot:TRINITY_DN12703_c0_g1_i1.p1 TRINITY_DN12703_c0_g1~~TRINITY_DN12703_c0_g1_i1.p1  ORF type:complete len:242 (-),score=43.04 TRINITY_DN12703_c0_g1_i1:88-813(-)
MICCWLMFNKDWDTAEDAQKFYAAARTWNRKGVTIPSQIRYIKYFEHRVKHGRRPQQMLFLNKIVLHNAPSNLPQEIKYAVYKGVRQVLVFEGKKKLKEITSKKFKKKKKKKDEDNSLTIEFPQKRVLLCGDWKFDMEKPGLHFWLNTAYIENNKVLLEKFTIDKVHKDKKDKLFDSSFSVELFFEPAGFAADYEDHAGTMATSSTSALPPAVSASKSRKGASAQFNFKTALHKYPSLRNL